MTVVVPTRLAVALAIGTPLGVGLHAGDVGIGFWILCAASIAGFVSAAVTWLVTTVPEEPEEAEEQYSCASE